MVQKFERKKFLINASFQTRYMLIMLVTVFLTVVICGFGVYFTVKTVIDQKLPSVSQQLLVADVIFGEVNKILLFMFPPVVIIIVILSIFLSHKVAGPEYRLGKVLDNVARGDFTGSTELRKSDELKNLASKLGIANKNLSVMIRQQREMLRSMVKEVKLIQKASGKGKLSNLAEVAKKAETLEKEFSRFKIQ